MPCDQVRKITVDLSALGRIDPNLLRDALQALGLDSEVQADKTLCGAYVSYRNGELTITGSARNRVTLDQVRQQYGVAVVRSTSRRFGWQLQEITEQQKARVTR